jgi:hypothetical protein
MLDWAPDADVCCRGWVWADHQLDDGEAVNLFQEPALADNRCQSRGNRCGCRWQVSIYLSITNHERLSRDDDDAAVEGDASMPGEERQLVIPGTLRYW